MSPRDDSRAEGDIVIDIDRTTTEAGAYPLVLLSYHIVCAQYDSKETADLVKAFETYVVSEEGQKAAADSSGSAPLSESLRKQTQAAVDTISAKGRASEADFLLTSGEIAATLGDVGVP